MFRASTTPSTHNANRIAALVGVMTLVALLPIWLYGVPSQDGPAHINTARVLTQLGLEPFYGEFYRSAWRLDTNQVYPALLSLLGYALPFEVAEKVILTLAVAALVLACWTAVRWLGGSYWAVLLVLPVIYALPTYLGFYNLVLAYPLFVLVLAWFVRWLERPSVAGAAVLGGLLLLMYFVHIVPTVCAVLLLGGVSLVRLLSPSSRRSALLALAATLPVGLVVVLFWLRNSRRLAEAKASGLELSALLSDPERFVATFVHGVMTPYEKVVYLVDWLGPADRLFTLPYLGLLGLLALLALVQFGRRGERARLGVPLGMAVLLGLLLLVVPERLGEIGWWPGRLLPLSILALVLALSKLNLSTRIWQGVALVMLGVMALLFANRLPLHARLHGLMVEYRTVAEALEPRLVLLPLAFDKGREAEMIGSGFGARRFNPFEHLAGYLVLERPLVNLGNYQPLRPYFPLHYRPERSPSPALEWRGELSFAPPLHVDPERYQRETGQAVEYIVTWGDPAWAAGDPGTDALLEQLGRNYRLTFVSEPRGLARVYERR